MLCDDVKGFSPIQSQVANRNSQIPFQLTSPPSNATFPPEVPIGPSTASSHHSSRVVPVKTESLQRAEKIVGYSFKNPQLLKESLTHASIADNRLLSNERMEFLGDAILDVIVCEALYLRFPEYLEGDLTKVKSAVVSRRTCAEISQETGLIDLLII